MCEALKQYQLSKSYLLKQINSSSIHNLPPFHVGRTPTVLLYYRKYGALSIFSCAGEAVQFPTVVPFKTTSEVLSDCAFICDSFRYFHDLKSAIVFV